MPLNFDFKSNEKIGIGVEIEVQLIDRITGDLKPIGIELLKRAADRGSTNRLKAELFQSMLEIDTPICKNAKEVGSSLRNSLSHARELAFEFEAEIMMAGTHPFAHYSERLLTPSGRYFSLVDRNKWIARRLQIFGLHIHLGMKNGEHAIKMNNALCHYLPIILAFSASSPFWQRDDTGLASSRITLFEAVPTGGHPFLVKSWDDFKLLIEKLIFSKSITSLKDLWWDIRPNLEYGTIEVRIADCPPTVKEIESIVALIHSLALHIDIELLAGREFEPPPEWVLRENKWRASRHGVDCHLIADAKGTSIPFFEIWNITCKTILPYITSYQYEQQFAFADEVIVKGPSYVRQRNHFKRGFDSLIHKQVLETKRDSPIWE